MVDPYHPEAGSLNERNPGGIWWLVAAIGIAVLLLAQVILFFNGFSTIPDKNKGAAVFALLGYLAIEVGLTLTALLQPGLTWGARAALFITAVVLATGLLGSNPLAAY